MITDVQKLTEIRREIRVRERVYPRWIENETLDEETASHRIEVMKAIEEDYRKLVQPSLFDKRKP